MTSLPAEDSHSRPDKLKAFALFSPHMRTLGVILYLVALPIIFTYDLLELIWAGGAVRAWDGTGHYGIAQIYDRTIFPDTFGWTHAHFGGMPFPNFYPPLFFWCVAFLHHTQLFSFDVAFKLLVVLPTLLMPVAMWLLGWTVSNGNRRIAFWTGLLSLIPLISARFGGHLRWSSGLDYFSTFAVGMYSQPLGFILLLLWYVAYVKAQRGVWRFALASLLLALAVLANYLNGVTAALFIAATVIVDLFKYVSAARAVSDARHVARRALLAHVASPLISAGLALFWLVPMFSTYEYLVTRPFTTVIITPLMVLWFDVALVGTICWLRRPSPQFWPFTLTCLVLTLITLFAAQVSPRWYPLQANRFAPMLNFFVAVPIAYAIAATLRLLQSLAARRLPQFALRGKRLAPYLFLLLLLLPVFVLYKMARATNTAVFFQTMGAMAFYPKVDNSQMEQADLNTFESATDADISAIINRAKPSEVNPEVLRTLFRKEHEQDQAMSVRAAITVNRILRFAQEHRDGRYAVELPKLYTPDVAAFDSHALNSFLGAQGNETLTVIFREASPNALFMYPQVNALSYNPDNFGFSSVLADDLDFAEQPVAKHLERSRLLGVKYLVVHSAKIKEKLAQESSIGSAHQFGAWTVFELREPPPPPIRALPYRPALVASSFTVKGRYSNESNFIRFAEEQFFDGWFDVPLVRAPQKKLDDLGSLSELNQFGALILDTYKCDRCDLVYRQLRDLAQSRPLILLADDDSLFHRMRNSIEEFPLATVIERETEDRGAWLNNFGPTRRYGSSAIRKQWTQIRQVLENNKIAVDAVAVDGQIKQNAIQVNYHPAVADPPELGTPVLISTTFHPNWRSNNGTPIYAANPMYMLVFVKQSTRLAFARRSPDRMSLWITATTLLGLIGFTLWSYRRSFKSARTGQYFSRYFRKRKDTIPVEQDDGSEENAKRPAV